MDERTSPFGKPLTTDKEEKKEENKSSFSTSTPSNGSDTVFGRPNRQPVNSTYVPTNPTFDKEPPTKQTESHQSHRPAPVTSSINEQRQASRPAPVTSSIRETPTPSSVAPRPAASAQANVPPRPTTSTPTTGTLNTNTPRPTARPAAPIPPRPTAPATPSSTQHTTSTFDRHKSLNTSLPSGATAPVVQREEYKSPNSRPQNERPMPISATIGGARTTTPPPSARPVPPTPTSATPTTSPQIERPAPISSSIGAAPGKPEVPTLDAAMFKNFSDFIYKISGIRFAENKSYFLSSKIKNRMDALGMSSLQEYFTFLQSPMSHTSEHPLLVDEITINETFFFRNQPQLEAFERDVLKPMLEKRRSQGINRIRMWSCAASTGDEAYTMALQLVDMPEARGFQFEIIGTDICRSAVATAQKAEYRKYAIRNIPQDMLKRYFTEDATGTKWNLNDEIKQFVRFQESNLMDEQRIRMLGKFDIAFCRNVLIYFDDVSKEKVLMNIYSALNDDGILLAGHSENLYPQRHIFKQSPELGQAMAYNKAPAGTQKLNV